MGKQFQLENVDNSCLGTYVTILKLGGLQTKSNNATENINIIFSESL